MKPDNGLGSSPAPGCAGLAEQSGYTPWSSQHIASCEGGAAPSPKPVECGVKSYLVDELSREEVGRVAALLRERGFEEPLEGVFWLPVPDELLTPEQASHRPSCGPFVLSLETGTTWLKLELLVRATGTLRCTCIGYATPEQRREARERLEAFLEALDISA